jgi:hypothetical protein
MNWKIALALIFVFIVLFYGITKLGSYLFSTGVSIDIRKLTDVSSTSPGEPLTESDLEGLPQPVKKYLRYAGVVGKAPIRTVRLTQKGTLRTAPDQGYMDFTATQYYATEPGGFVWSADVKMLPGIFLLGRDTYINGHGEMKIKILGLFSMVDSEGEEMDQGSMIRYINEHIWFPTAFLNEYFNWISLDNLTAEAIVRFGGIKARIIFYFNEMGQMINFETERYRSLDNGRFEICRWSTPMSDYMEINGFRIPTRGQAVWHMQDRDFQYIDLEITDIQYNIDLVKTD